MRLCVGRSAVRFPRGAPAGDLLKDCVAVALASSLAAERAIEQRLDADHQNDAQPSRRPTRPTGAHASPGPVRLSRGLVPGFVRGGALMTDGLLRRVFWRVADQLDYLVTLARLRILDALTGALPETAADRQWQRDLERIKRAFPEIER